jgi:hypothetical protein
MKRCLYHIDRPAKARGLCSTCYGREWRHSGEILPTQTAQTTTCACGEIAGRSGQCRRCYFRAHKRAVRAGKPTTPRAQSSYQRLWEHVQRMREELDELKVIVWGA